MSKKLVGFNKNIGVEPPHSYTAEKKIVGGVASPVHRVAMAPLKVVIGNGTNIEPGMTVYVPAIFLQHKWATDVYEIDGLRFCLLTEQNVVAVSSEEDDAD